MKFALNLIIVSVCLFLSPCDDGGKSAVAQNEVVDAIKSSTSLTPVDGTGLIIVVDCSGSMSETVEDVDGKQVPKIEIARHSTSAIIKQAQSFAARNNSNVKAGILVFSNTTQELMPLQTPDITTAQPLINSMATGGGTNIGDAVVVACQRLNNAGFTSKHIIVVTDGENTGGKSPSDVAEAFKQLPTASQPKVYVVAFDVDAGVFKQVIQSGWMVLPAKDGQQLQRALNEIVSGEILLEK